MHYAPQTPALVIFDPVTHSSLKAIQISQLFIGLVSDCCLTPSQLVLSYIITRTSYFLIKWWWRLFFTKSTNWVGFLYC